MQSKPGQVFQLSPFQGGMEGTVHLPVSKSESNRALMLEAYSNQRIKAGLVSTARDSQVLIQALSSDEPTIDVGDAGTAFRFLTVYFALKGGSKQLTGSSRMKERPIGTYITLKRWDIHL
jgi:3-phosphoshikimate 1-carboxyvinyltransferase